VFRTTNDWRNAVVKTKENIVPIKRDPYYDTTIPETYLALAKGAVAKVGAHWRGLTPFGYEKDGADKAFNVKEIATALMFIQLGPYYGPGDSYGLKHIAEHWGRILHFAPYIANGAFIVAALFDQMTRGSKGCRVKPYGGTNPNASIRIPRCEEIDNYHF
jgi:hypothetical protein